MTARTSSQWTPPSHRLRRFNFSPRSGRMRGCWSNIFRNKKRKKKREREKVGREQKNTQVGVALCEERTHYEFIHCVGSLIRRAFILGCGRSQEFIFGRILLVLIANQVSVSSAEGGEEEKTFNCYYFLYINSEISLLWNKFSDKPPDQRDALLFSPDYLSSPLSLERMRCRWVKHELSENQS